MSDGSQSFSRRDFLRISSSAAGSAAVAGAFDSLLSRSAHGAAARQPGYGPLRPIKDQTTGLPLLQLPEGFTYSSFGWTGDALANGEKTPAQHDGMAVVAEDDAGLLTIVRNHEIRSDAGSFGNEAISYDPVAGGGCTNIRFNGRTGEWQQAVPSLGGTIKNCAGGPTPWGSWLSCEEAVAGPRSVDDGRVYDFQRTHGWIFEVPAEGQATAVPLKDMGCFVHEAVAVDPETGIVYETEDADTAGFYRFLPKQAGQLSAGGTLEMLKVPGVDDLRRNAEPGRKYPCEWVRIEDPQRGNSPGKTDGLGVYQQGRELGATRFARLEGCWYGNDLIYFVSTSGGNTGNGQIWAHDPKSQTLQLVFESPSAELLESPDNLAVSPRGGIVLCEDGDLLPQRLHGLTPDGQLFEFAANNVQLRGEHNDFRGDFRGSEWAGATFSPDGQWLFANIQDPGITVAITGPWQDRGL